MLSWYQLLNFAELSPQRINNLANQHDVHYEDVERAAKIDPSHNGKYVPWLLKNQQYYSRTIGDTLSKFHNHQQNLPKEHRDINKHNIDTLRNAVKGIPDKSNTIPKILPHGAELERQSGPYHFIKVTTPEASHKLGGTSWCIGQKESPEATNYLKDGPLHIVYKNGKRHAGIHLNRGEFRDSQNKELGDEETNDLMDHWGKHRVS